MSRTMQMRLRLYPQSAIPRRNSDALSIADRVTDLIARDRGEGAGDISEVAGTGIAGTWGNQDFTAEPSLRYIKFSDVAHEGVTAATQRGIGGFMLRARIVPQNCRVRGDSGDVPSGNAGFDTLWFKVLKGEIHNGKTLWKTVLPNAQPLRSRVYHTRQTPNRDVKIRTENPLQANQGCIVDLTELQIATGQTQKARIRIERGNFSVVLRQDNFATFEMRDTPASSWRSIREFTASGKNLLENALQIRFEIQAGRSGIEISSGGQTISYNILHTQNVYGSDPPRFVEIDAHWPRAPLTFLLYGVQAHIGVSLLNYTTAQGVPLTGAWTKALQFNGRGELDLPATGRALGWERRGASTSMTVLRDEGGLSYACVLSASPDGLTSPFQSGGFAYIEPVWEEIPSLPLDVTIAINGPVRENGAQIGVTADAQWSCDLSRTRLDTLPLPADAPAGATWEHYLVPDGYNPCDFSVRFLENGVWTAWAGRFKGYVYQQTRDSEAINNQMASLVMSGPLLRYTAPAAVLGKDTPILLKLFDVADVGDIFAADCIREVVRVVLGDSEAARFNGNGDARRFLPPGKAPLIARETDTIGLYGGDGKPPTSDQMLLKPPWLQDGNAWIKQLQNDDSGGQGAMVWLYGFADSDGIAGDSSSETWPHPIYGDVVLLLQNRNRWIIPDARYEGEESHLWLRAAHAQTRPDQDFNHWIVANHFGETEGFDLVSPALQMSEARLPPDDPRSEEQSWRRTEVVEMNNAGLIEPYLESIAVGMAIDSENLSPVHPSLTFSGEAKMQTGDLVKPLMLKIGSDRTLRLNEKWFRIIKLDNEYGTETPGMTSTAIVFPLSDAESAQLGLT